MRQRLLARAAVVAALSCLLARSASADPSAKNLALQALSACESGRLAKVRSERAQHFTDGEALATRAVALDDRCAEAHFALFCNRGETMRLDGESLRDVIGLRGLLHELDRTLELAPDNADALSAKGNFLVRLPRVLGGDLDRGEAMLKRVIELDPTAVNARIGLARVCDYRGDRAESLRFATRALEVAKETGRSDRIADAQAMLAELGATAH
jgi:tetratricopeptide (TPR) repeat protein